MKLQGVEILRISDFRRFFTIEEFLLNKADFAHLFSTIDVSNFCDTPEESALCSQVRLWCLGQTPNARIDLSTNNICLPMGSPVALGYIANVQKKYANALKPAEQMALACLCLLLGSYCTTKEAEYIYNYMTGGNTMQQFVSISANLNLKQFYLSANEPCFRKVYANLMPDKEFVIKCGRQAEKLQYGECVVAIHTSNGCIALLPRTVYSNDTNARLMINTSTHQPYLEVTQLNAPQRKIKNVVSFWIEPGLGLIYTTFNNEVKKAFGKHENDNDFSSCYSFNLEYNTFCKCNPNNILLAITKTNDYYTFYSTTKNDNT